MLQVVNMECHPTRDSKVPVTFQISGELTDREIGTLRDFCFNTPVSIVPDRVPTHRIESILKDLIKKSKPDEPLFGGAWYDSDGELIYITRVMYNDPATIVFWNDSTKTVAKCAKEDTYSKETGLAMAILKKLLGGTTVAKTFADWLSTEKVVDLKDLRAKKRAVEKAAKEAAKKAAAEKVVKTEETK